MVKDVGLRIQKAVEQYCAENELSPRLKGYNWKFNLVEDPNVNAWCTPGGKVVVYTGLLPISQNEAGLAVALKYKDAIMDKKTEFIKLGDKLKEIPVAEM